MERRPRTIEKHKCMMMWTYELIGRSTTRMRDIGEDPASYAYGYNEPLFRGISIYGYNSGEGVFGHVSYLAASDAAFMAS
jgi:hypothetical protein